MIYESGETNEVDVTLAEAAAVVEPKPTETGNFCEAAKATAESEATENGAINDCQT